MNDIYCVRGCGRPARENSEGEWFGVAQCGAPIFELVCWRHTNWRRVIRNAVAAFTGQLRAP